MEASMTDPLQAFEELAKHVEQKDAGVDDLRVMAAELRTILLSARLSLKQMQREAYMAGTSDGWTTRMYSEKPWDENRLKFEAEAARRNP
jgi:hypothetical protein